MGKHLILDGIKGSSFDSVRIKILPNYGDYAPPHYATLGSSGFDFRAAISDKVFIHPGELRVFGSGLSFDLPENYELQVRGRSSLAFHRKLVLAPGVGTIDSDYIGEVMVMLHNIGDEGKWIEPGDRIAQGVFAKIYRVDFEIVKEIEKRTERGDKGFGSTGVF